MTPKPYIDEKVGMTKGSPRWRRGPKKPQLPIMRRQTTASRRFRISSTMQITSPPSAGQTEPPPMTTRQCCESAICSRLREIVQKRGARLAHDRGYAAHPQARHRRLAFSMTAAARYASSRRGLKEK